MKKTYGLHIGIIGIILILCFPLKSIVAQSTPVPAIGTPLQSAFVKKRIFQKNGELSFNIIRLYNYSDQQIRIKPILTVPDRWSVFSTSFIDTVIQSNDTISLPFSIKIPSGTPADIDHSVIFQAFTSQNKLILTDSFYIQTEPYHNWDVTVPDKRFFFYPRMNKAEFEIVVKNKGNTAETIHLEIRPDKKLTVETIGGIELIQDITIEPGTDTSLFFTASYTYDKSRIFDISKVQILASSDQTSLYRAIIIEKYDDTYAPLHVNKNLPNEIEVGLRNFTSNQEILPFLKARGVADFNTRGALSYNFTYHDLTETENIIGNTYYQFLYTRKALNVGVGAFSSTLGRNLYSRNCLMLANEIDLSPSSKLKGYASFGYIEPKSSVALSYNYTTDNFSMNTDVAYDLDVFRNARTGSFRHHFGEIKLHPKHSVSAILYSYYEQHDLEQTITQFGVAYDFRYSGQFGKRFSIQINNNYGSPDIPGPQMGLISYGVFAKYKLDERTRYLVLKYFNSKKKYYLINPEGFRFPDINLSDQYASLIYNSNVHKNYKWSLGPSIEFYKSINPLIGLGITKDFDLQKFRLEYKATIGRHFRFSLKGGLSRESNADSTNKYADKYDFHLLGDYNNKGYGVRMAYDYGPMVNTGLYQYALDVGNNTFILSPYLMKNYLGGLIGVSLFSNFTYRIDLKYASLNVNPKVEAYILKDWYFVLGGTYNLTSQEFNGRVYQNSFFYLEASIKKKWGHTGKDKRDRDIVRLKVLVYQDDNGNGYHDNGEAGISFVKTRVILTSSPDESTRQGLPVDITLLSNESGYSTFNRIPKGNYEVYITPLSEMKEYFYVSQTSETLELFENTTFEIPFQKANKIVGQVIVKRQKFIKEDEQGLSLKNIRITAYNNDGNSYSVFTDEQGRFVLFAPGGLTYYLRMENVFGNNFKILQNDISTQLSDTLGAPIIFNIVESSRKINLKKTTLAEAGAEKKKIQKIKVLSGEVYDEKNSHKRVDKAATPKFEIVNDDGADPYHVMVPGKFYVIIGHERNMEDALKLIKIYREQNVNAYLGVDDYTETYYVFTDVFDTKSETKEEISRLKGKKVKDATILEFLPY